MILALTGLVVRAESPARMDASRLIGRGDAEVDSANFKLALECYREALAAADATGNGAEQAVAVGRVGRAFDCLNQYDTALEYEHQALAAARKIGDRRAVPDILRYIGNVYLDQAQYLPALDFYQKALAAAQATGDREGVDRVLGNIGIAYADLGRYDRALVYRQRALAVDREIGDRKGEEQDLNGIGVIYLELAQYTKALEVDRKALVEAQAVGDRRTQEGAIGNIGMAYTDLGLYDQALEYRQKALAFDRVIGDRRGEEKDLAGMGIVYEDLARYDQALEYDRKALAEAQAVGDTQTETGVFANIGIVDEDLAEYDSALEYDRKALAVDREIGDQSGAEEALCNIGIVYDDVAQYDRALQYDRKSLSEAQAIGDRSTETRELANIGIVYEDLARYDTALEFDRKSLAEAQAIGDRSSEERTLENIGIVYCDLGQYDKALEYDRKSLADAHGIGDRSTVECELGNIGNVYADRGQYDRALEYDRKSLAEAQAIGDASSAALGLSSLMRLYRDGLQRPLLAIFYGKQAVNVYQEIRGNVVGMDGESRREYRKSHEKTYRDLAGLLIAQGRLPEAQQVLDLLKDEEYNGYLRRSTTTISVSPSPLAGRVGWGSGVEYTGLEQKFADALKHDFDTLAVAGKTADSLQKTKNRLRALGRIAEWTAARQSSLDAADSDVEAANALYEKTISDLNAAFAGRPSAGMIDVANCSQLQDTLRDLDASHSGAVAVYTLVTDDTLYEMLVTPKVVVSARSAVKSTDLNAMIAEFRTEIQNPTLDPRPVGKKLYDLIFGPLAANLDSYHATTLMWSLDGAMRYLPIAALWDGSEYVAERYAVSEFTTASEPTLDASPIARWAALAVGVSREHDVKDEATGTVCHFPALASVPVELSSVVRAGATGTGVLPGTILLDDQFKLAAFSDALAENDADSPAFPVIHIASHFDLDPANGDESALLLGDGTTLKVADLANMPNDFHNVDLVTLSACDTAVASSSTNGAEVDGFGMLAQRRGAKSVIATLWAVYDPSTCAFMRRFYSLHASGLTKAEALRQAQLALLHGAVDALAPGAHRQVDRPDADESPSTSMPAAPAFPVDPKAPYAHPYYWAPFILMGNWR